MRFYVAIGLLSLNSCATVQAVSASPPIIVSNNVPAGASQAIGDAFISFAIELSTFPAFAGSAAAPNTYSDNLLNNIGNLTGVKPYIRVGGNAQDIALYNATTKNAVIPKSASNPDIQIGSSFFDCYSTWPNTKFSHGFNLGLGATTTAGWNSLLATVPFACNALRGKLVAWEYGNEPDLYINNGLRPNGWGVPQYVSEWQNGTRQIHKSIAASCPDMVAASVYGYIGLSLWGDVSTLDPTAVWNDLQNNKDIKMVSFHNYMAGTNSSGVSLQGTLMNHAHTTASVHQHLVEYASIINSGTPIIVGEAGSLFNVGTPGITDTFGAALWTLDYNLWCASQNITRVHMQQGLNFFYNAWQPIDTPLMAIGTKAPYYGSIAAAAMIGNSSNGQVRIANIPLSSTTDVAYGAYVNGKLSRIAVLNMRAYNATGGGSGTARPSQSHVFSIPGIQSTSATVRKLWADGSDVTSGATFDGYSYDYSLDEGKPVLLSNMTRGTQLMVQNGLVTVDVMDSSAVILEFV